MNRKRAERGPFATSQTALFFCTILSEVRSMKNWIDRLVKCGIPEKTAENIINYFFKRRRTVELIAYVKLTEEAMGRQ